MEFIITSALVLVLGALYGLACGIAWSQCPSSSGYSLADRVVAVVGQAAVITGFLAAFAGLAWAGLVLGILS